MGALLVAVLAACAAVPSVWAHRLGARSSASAMLERRFSPGHPAIPAVAVHQALTFQRAAHESRRVATASVHASALAPLRSARFLEDWEETPDRLAPFVGEDTIGRKAEIWLPSTWSVFVANGSLKLLHYVGDEAVFTARLPDESQSDVVLLKKVEDGERAVREAKISQRLTAFASLGYSAGRGHIVSRFDVQTHPEGTFVLSEPITYGLEGTPTLAQVLRKRHETFVQGLPLNPYSDAGRPMSLAQASRIFIDVLRGLTFLDDAGICHIGLSPNSVLLQDGRAVIDGLGDMCYAFDGRDPLLACRGRLDVTDWEAQSGVSALWQAPELDHGCARGPPDHSWTAGLLYASMRFGYNPAARAAAKHIDGWVAMVMYDVTSEGRAALRDLVADSFDIRMDPGFRDASPGEQEMLRGMLERDRAKRWTAERALKEAIALAEERQLEVPLARKAPRTPIALQAGAGVADISDAWQ